VLNLFSFNSSERIGKTNANGLLLTEAKYINLSLHYLEQVILTRKRKEKEKNSNHFNLTKGHSCPW
jgi:kinesin family member 6/9